LRYVTGVDECRETIWTEYETLRYVSGKPAGGVVGSGEDSLLVEWGLQRQGGVKWHIGMVGLCEDGD
jgi:hypothetical protein